jgi:hypothetical protein
MPEAIVVRLAVSRAVRVYEWPRGVKAAGAWVDAHADYDGRKLHLDARLTDEVKEEYRRLLLPRFSPRKGGKDQGRTAAVLYETPGVIGPRETARAGFPVAWVSP